jgi:hypothetical protein
MEEKKMKNEYSISYQKHNDKDGTVYDQTINITMPTLRALCKLLQQECKKKKYHKPVICGKNYYKWLYLKSSFGEVENGFVFMNLTQRDFFKKHLQLNSLKDRNTCFCII